MSTGQSISEEIRYQLRLILAISLGMFLFLLFFLPFEYRKLEFNENLLFIVGLCTISFLVMAVFRILLPSTLKNLVKLEADKISNEVVVILMIWLFNSLGYVFYLRYVGLMELSLFKVVKITIFSGFPSIILKLADVNMSLRTQLKHLVEKNIRLEKHLPDKEKNERPPEQFISDSQTDRILIHPDDIILIKSADNYVNIIFKDQEKVRQKMLRMTITHMQSQLKKYPEFLRCHRTCIINSSYIINLISNYKGYRLKLLDYNEEVPVSRQYILSIKAYLDSE